MGIEKIFEENTERKDAVDEIRGVIRKSIDEITNKAINEKYKKEEEVEEEIEESEEEDDKKSEDDDGDEEEEEDDEDGDEEEDDDEEVKEEEEITESMEVSASRVGGRKGIDKFTINRLSDLKKLGKSRQYDYFMVVKKNGDEIEYSVDPQGNIVEL